MNRANSAAIDPQSTYQLLDSGFGRKLEKINNYKIIRPASQAMWSPETPKLWNAVDYELIRKEGGQAEWIKLSDKPMPKAEPIAVYGYPSLLQFTDFGHVGFFAEQYQNWQRLHDIASAQNKPLNVLNLFGYTGMSSRACAAGGAHVVHVDASKTAVAWGRRCYEHFGEQENVIRWIVDDVVKFVKREIKRERRYHGIILDPPSFGRGPQGEIWKIEESLQELADLLSEIMDEDFKFLLASCHSAGVTSKGLENIFASFARKQKNLRPLHEELVIPQESNENISLTSGVGLWMMSPDLSLT